MCWVGACWVLCAVVCWSDANVLRLPHGSAVDCTALYLPYLSQTYHKRLLHGRSLHMCDCGWVACVTVLGFSRVVWCAPLSSTLQCTKKHLALQASTSCELLGCMSSWPQYPCRWSSPVFFEVFFWLYVPCTLMCNDTVLLTHNALLLCEVQPGMAWTCEVGLSSSLGA